MFPEDEVVQSNGAYPLGRERYTTLFAMGYSPLYLLSLGTMVVCRAGSDSPRFGRDGRKHNLCFPQKKLHWELGIKAGCLFRLADRAHPQTVHCIEPMWSSYLMYTMEFWTWSVRLQLSIFLLQTKEIFPEVCWIAFIVKCFWFQMSFCVNNLVWRLFHCTLLDQVLFTIQWIPWPSNPI